MIIETVYKRSTPKKPRLGRREEAPRKDPLRAPRADYFLNCFGGMGFGKTGGLNIDTKCLCAYCNYSFKEDAKFIERDLQPSWSR